MYLGTIKRCGSCQKTRYFSLSNPKCECGWIWNPEQSQHPSRTVYVQTDSIKPYFDVGVGREIESRSQIKKICSDNNYVYGGAEIDQQAESNRHYQKQKMSQGLEQLKERIRYELY